MREGFDDRKNVDMAGKETPDDVRQPGQLLTGRMLGGAAWLFGSYALSRTGRVVMMLAVAALLSPGKYGLIGLTTVILTIVQILNEFGIWQAVVHRSDPDEEYLNTAFFANALGGLFNTAVVWFVAPSIAGFYGEPEMTTLFRVMALSLFVDGLTYVPDGLLRKALRFKSRALPEIAGTFGAGVATIVLILLGAGVVSYAIGFVVDSVIRCLLTFWKVRWRPGPRVSAKSLGEMASYAKHIVGADLARHVSANLDYLVVGRVLGVGPLGFYTLAFNLANYPVSNFAYVLSRLAFPAFATLQGDIESARRVYLNMVRIVAAVVLPLLALLAVLAEPLLVGVLGEKWQPAVIVLQIMAVAGISRALSMPGFDMLRALGLPNVPFRVSVSEGLVMAAALLLFAHRGIEVVAFVVTVIMSLFAWATTLATCGIFGIKLRSLARTLVPGMVLAVGGSVPALVLVRLEVDLGSHTLGLIAPVLAAAVGVLVCLLTVLRGFSRDSLRAVLSKRPS